jgi:hypothetical protein
MRNHKRRWQEAASYGPFRENQKGNFCGTLDGKFCTVFQGPLGGWSFFLGGEAAGEWWDNAEDAMHAAMIESDRRIWQRSRNRKPTIPACITFFSLPWPTTREALNAAYRRVSLTAHPDRGGNHEAMKLTNRMYEEACRCL